MSYRENAVSKCRKRVFDDGLPAKDRNAERVKTYLDLLCEAGIPFSQIIVTHAVSSSKYNSMRRNIYTVFYRHYEEIPWEDSQ